MKGGTDVTDYAYMKMKTMLKSRGVDQAALDRCTGGPFYNMPRLALGPAGAPSLIILGNEHAWSLKPDEGARSGRRYHWPRMKP